jgi:hypothetical protein
LPLDKSERLDSNNSQCENNENNSFFSKAPGGRTHRASSRKGISKKGTVKNSEVETVVARQTTN